LARKVKFAKATIAQLWQESSVIMAHLAASSGGQASSETVTQSPTRAAAKANFRAKLQSLVFNPIEWLDAAEQKALIQSRKMQNSLAAMSADGESSTMAFQIPYASAPHGQSLHWQATKPLNFVQCT
jgi:hypothetical protein